MIHFWSLGNMNIDDDLIFVFNQRNNKKMRNAFRIFRLSLQGYECFSWSNLSYFIQNCKWYTVIHIYLIMKSRFLKIDSQIALLLYVVQVVTFTIRVFLYASSSYFEVSSLLLYYCYMLGVSSSSVGLYILRFILVFSVTFTKK